MKNEYNYFYKITNLINERYYFGVHKTNKIEDGYMGSGKRLKYAIIKYGMENFKKEIIKYFNTFEEALNYEAEIVTENLVNDIECYNLKLGGTGGWSYVTSTRKNVHNNKVVVFNKSGNTMMIDLDDIRYINGDLKSIHKNKINVKDNNNNYYHINIDDERYINGDLKPIWTNRKHTEETKIKIGITNSINQKGEKNSQFGTCWVMKESENKKIKKEELNIYLSGGWIKGRKIIKNLDS